jgi:hypothetical protein
LFILFSRMCTNRTSPECPKHPVQPLHHTLVILEEEVGVDPNTRKGTARFQDGVTIRCDSSSIDLPQGLEPRFSGPKPGVLPIRRGENL